MGSKAWADQAMRLWERHRQRVGRPAGPALRTGFVVLATVLFVGGILAFTGLQHQALFKDTVDVGITEGRVPRNDGGILFGAILVGLGAALLLRTASPAPGLDHRGVPRRTTSAFFGVAGAVAALLVLHMSIFVNAVVIPATRVVAFQATFLFHDDATLMPMAIFILGALTLLLLLGGIIAALGLVAPDLVDRHVRHPRHTDAHRTRVALWFLFVAGISMAFVREFLAYALEADADPAGTFLAQNLLLVLYLLAFALVIALALAAWRTIHLVFGDIRAKRSITYRNALRTIRNAEMWAWGIALALDLIVLWAPALDPPIGASRVVAINSRGTALLMIPLIYGALFAHRRADLAYLRHLANLHSDPPATKKDPLAALIITTSATWALVTLAMVGSDLAPVTQLTIRIAIIAAILPFFALRIEVQTPGRFLELRGAGAPLILIATTALSMTAGLMLWGLGNTVSTTYTPNGGFTAHPDDLLGPYSVGIRALGSMFIAIPVTLALGLLARRSTSQAAPGPLLVVCFSIILSMNLLLTINAANPFDSALNQRDVLVGFRLVELAGTFDKVVVTIVWTAIAAVGSTAAVMLLRRGTRNDDVHASGSLQPR